MYSDNYNNLMRIFFDAMLYRIEGQDPTEAIINAEKRSQKEFCDAGNLLPIKCGTGSIPSKVFLNGVNDNMEYEERKKICDSNTILYTKEKYEQFGIKILETKDDNFYVVELPEGWRIEAAPDHQMWNYLYNDKGEEVLSVFLKQSAHCETEVHFSK